MHEESEVINFILSIILFAYCIYLLKRSEIKINILWIYAMVCIVLSNASTVIEGYVCYELFDYLEHGLYMIAGLLFFIGALRLKTF